MGRRWGKTTLGVLLATEPALAGKPVGWFAPTYQYLMEPWRDLNRLLAPAIERASIQERRIDLKTGGSIDFWTLENIDAGRGRKYARAITDEAGLVPTLEESWTHAMRPTLADLKGDAWFLGTPKPKRYFVNLYRKGQSGDQDWISWNLPTTDNPFISRKEIEAARAGMPADAFRQEWEGIEADDGGNPFGLAAIQACIADLASGPAVQYGVDLAKSTDWTVVAGLNAEGKCCELHRFQRPWVETISSLRSILRNVPSLIDSTGVGDPIVEALQRDLGSVEGFKFSRQSKQQIMEGLAVAIQHRAVSYPSGWLVNELEAFGYEYTPTGVRYSAPDGLHDDGVVALALSVHGYNQVREIPHVSVFGSDERNPDGYAKILANGIKVVSVARGEPGRFFGDE